MRPLVAFLALVSPAQDGGTPAYPDMPVGAPAPVVVEGAEAASPDAMQRYAERIAGTEATFEMLPIPAGTFRMGSPEGEAERDSAEGPQHDVRVEPFWMGRCEVSWDEYHPFMLKRDLALRAAGEVEAHANDAFADAVSRPTPPYVPMDFDMGVAGYPAVCMTQLAAKQYTKWLSMKTGRFYRLPTEAEWEYACRAGTTTAYSFGDDPGDLDAHGWYFDNAPDGYARVGQLAPNPWGLFDMHGNVAEWVLDAFDRTAYRAREGISSSPLVWPTELYPRCVRGGSWDDDAELLRSAARRGSKPRWKIQDPQLPKSIWYHTDAPFVGFRVVRPFTPPSAEEQARYWDADLDSVREIVQKQRLGGR